MPPPLTTQASCRSTGAPRRSSNHSSRGRHRSPADDPRPPPSHLRPPTSSSVAAPCTSEASCESVIAQLNRGQFRSRTSTVYFIHYRLCTRFSLLQAKVHLVHAPHRHPTRVVFSALCSLATGVGFDLSLCSRSLGRSHWSQSLAHTSRQFDLSPQKWFFGVNTESQAVPHRRAPAMHHQALVARGQRVSVRQSAGSGPR